ncbi:2OG-Fe dioxygenase family protein [Streptomyces olivoreticuli]|uniref:2OG-Fe dioxygenase family protein n=1 Tax=Streptomyces olivoreticuli TaxID=68246 RepID=UPI0013C322E8|nr:2OG-Fe dioxygenase family protein [Streptomyces olivoreticuli]
MSPTLPGSSGPGLAELGFARYHRQDVLSAIDGFRTDSPDTASLFDEIRRSFADLPADPYDEAANRFRQYGSAVLLPWERSLTWLPADPGPGTGRASEYYQGDHNPEYAGMRRHFGDIATHVRENPLLRKIILFDADRTLWLKHFGNVPLRVGVHFIKLSVDNPGDVAVPSPDVLHQDGEPFTFVHLISRDNVTGGVNVIAPPRCAGLRPEEVSRGLLQAEFTLEDPLDSFAIHDPRVSHYVSPVRRGDRPRRGERDVVLVDFTPYVTQI